MDLRSLEEFKEQLKDFEKRLDEKEKDHQEYLAGNHSADDLGIAREIFEDILRGLPKESEPHKWDERQDVLNEKLASLLIQISQ